MQRKKYRKEKMVRNNKLEMLKKKNSRITKFTKYLQLITN